MFEKLDPRTIRELFDSLREGTQTELDVDIALYNMGIDPQTRDAMFEQHTQQMEKRESNTAPPANVLRNPDLSGPYTTRGAQELNVAPGWDLCYRHDEPSPLGPQDPVHFCCRPEYKPILRMEFPDRVVLGNSAQCAFTRWRVMDACIYQRIAVPVGALLTLQADVQAWCSDSDDPTACDGEMYFRLGIDLKGDYTFFKPDDESALVWGDWIRATSVYQTIEMQAIAPGPNVTVYVNFWNKYRYSHNDAYIDAVRLLVEPPKPDPEPRPGEYVTRAELIDLFRDMADMLEACPCWPDES